MYMGIYNTKEIKRENLGLFSKIGMTSQWDRDCYFPLKFLLHFFLATCWPAGTAFPTLPHSQMCPQDYVLTNGSRKWHVITCPEPSPSSFTWREPSYGSNPAMTMQITAVTIPRATGQKEPDSQRGYGQFCWLALLTLELLSEEKSQFLCSLNRSIFQSLGYSNSALP